MLAGACRMLGFGKGTPSEKGKPASGKEKMTYVTYKVHGSYVTYTIHADGTLDLSSVLSSRSMPRHAASCDLQFARRR